jgi:protein gp37
MEESDHYRGREHSGIKHYLLERYPETLFMIIGQQERRVCYVDGFAGPWQEAEKISPGCKHCYAETMARRLHAMGVRGYEAGFKLTLVPERLAAPLRRRKPTVYFVNSMSDLSHEQVQDAYIQRVFDVIRQTPQHIYQIPTKRAERLPKFFSEHDAPENAWLGVSVENRKHGLPRIEALRGIRTRIRFLSVEPLPEDPGEIDLHGIHWVIVGGESGPKARPMKQDWVINIQRQCKKTECRVLLQTTGRLGRGRQKAGKKTNRPDFAGKNLG